MDYMHMCLLQELDCYLLDYNGYIVLSENREEVLVILKIAQNIFISSISICHACTTH